MGRPRLGLNLVYSALVISYTVIFIRLHVIVKIKIVGVQLTLQVVPFASEQVRYVTNRKKIEILNLTASHICFHSI